MAFLPVYRSWMEKHLNSRSGERERRLAEGHGHAEMLFLEKVWYPAFGEFENLDPEYEVSDFRDGSRFLDFAFIRFPLRLALEIDGYGPHSSKTSRWQFSDSLMRQNYLIIDGWRILRFSYDDVNEKPRMCEQLLQQFMGTWFNGSDRPNQSNMADLLESAVLKLALRTSSALQTKDVCHFLNIQQDKARSILRSMVIKQTLIPAYKGTKRIHGYIVNKDLLNEKLGPCDPHGRQAFPSGSIHNRRHVDATF